MYDVDLSQRLLLAESDLLTALESGTEMLSSYHQTWSALSDALSTATRTRDIGNDKFILVNFVASRISNLASCFLDIRHEEELSTSQLQSDCDAMFRQMDALDLSTQPKTSSPAYVRTSTLNVESTSLIFAPAHQWLIDNLHNPYPTAQVKARIATASSCQVSSINTWFINARRRIGWTTLCRKRFSNCRVDMIDAAYRALVEEDPQCALSPELRHSFVAMKVAAENLYSSAFNKSAFSGELDPIVKDMTEKDSEAVEVGKHRQVEQANFKKVVQDSYPSPNPSVIISLVPTLDDSFTNESEEEDVAPPIIAGSKRCRSSIEPVDQPSSTASRPIKRLRSSMTSPTCLPSPPSSTDGIDEPADYVSLECSSVHPTPPETNKPSRKRRLSDTDTTDIPKRPRDSMATPRLHTVSDSPPRSITENECFIDDWFKTNFDDLFVIPPPVDAIEPDFSAPWEVELFKDYSIPRDPKNAPECLLAPTVDTDGSAPPGLSDFDSLLQSIRGDTFVSPSDNVPPSEAPYSASLDSFIPDIAQTDIDWAPLLHGAPAYQPNYSTFHQYPDSQPLAEIDLSMLQLPHVMPSVNSQGNLASKQAKLHQLHAMQEVVRRMEQELRSEGVVI